MCYKMEGKKSECKRKSWCKFTYYGRPSSQGGWIQMEVSNRWGSKLEYQDTAVIPKGWAAVRAFGLDGHVHRHTFTSGYSRRGPKTLSQVAGKTRSDRALSNLMCSKRSFQYCMPVSEGANRRSIFQQHDDLSHRLQRPRWGLFLLLLLRPVGVLQHRPPPSA